MEAAMISASRTPGTVTRRSVLAMATGGVLAGADSRPLQFGFSLYGMKTLPFREGLAHVARIGYQCTELSLRAGWDTEPKLLTKADRAATGMSTTKLTSRP